jgi:hypothetical protein
MYNLCIIFNITLTEEMNVLCKEFIDGAVQLNGVLSKLFGVGELNLFSPFVSFILISSVRMRPEFSFSWYLWFCHQKVADGWTSNHHILMCN